MHHPERCIADRQTFDENVPAPIRLDERRPQVMARAVHPVRNRHALLGLLEEKRAIGELRLWRMTLADRLPIPPMRLISLPVERALAGDRDILAIERVDQRRIVHPLDAFPTRHHQWIAR